MKSYTQEVPVLVLNPIQANRIAVGLLTQEQKQGGFLPDLPDQITIKIGESELEVLVLINSETNDE